MSYRCNDFGCGLEFPHYGDLRKHQTSTGHDGWSKTMGELKQINFDVWTDEATDRIIEMHCILNDQAHDAKVEYIDERSGCIVTCSCRADCRWFISKQKATKEEIRATFNAHLSFFARPATKPD